MINNRQNGRRRGRGGGPRSPNNAPGPGNRQDNRSRGNAAQLHEKYKAMARDAQLAGDRVQTEYYLQFADHYFRVLSEGRARFEEQRRQRDDYGPDDDEDQDEASASEQEERDERPAREDRPYREERAARDDRPREERPVREERQPRREPRAEREPRPEQDEPTEPRNGAAPRTRRSRRVVEETEGGGEEKIAVDSLPPAIAPDAGEAKPRRRTRRPRAEGEDIAPAA